MEKTELRFIDYNYYAINLVKVNYSALNAAGNQPRVIIHDDYRIIDINSQNVKIELTRKVYFEPKGILEAEVVSEIKYNLKNEADRPEIEKEIYDNLFNLLTPLAARASLIIGVISHIHLNNPIINPPFPLMKESKPE